MGSQSYDAMYFSGVTVSNKGNKHSTPQMQYKLKISLVLSFKITVLYGVLC